MEKYSAFRDRGSGIAPFFPIPTQPAGYALPFHAFLFVVRVFFLVPITVAYFLLLSWLPIGSLGKKAVLWCMLGVPGIWWIDLGVDGVKKGSLGQNQHKLPQPGSVIASSYTSPIDALYLAAIFDPVFTRSFPGERKVQRITLFQAMLQALMPPVLSPPKDAKLVPISDILRETPDRCVAVFPECTATNGRGILPFCPSLLTVPVKTKIFPVSLRYTPADVTTPVPGSYFSFLWNLCSKPTHCIRVRIAEATFNEPPAPEPPRKNSFETNLLDDLHSRTTQNGDMTKSEKESLDKIAESLARLGRVKRLGLGPADKIAFIKVWSKRRS
ncbi:putative vacuolar protein sorting protein Vps66, partial [Aureobasidium melanogenum]